MKTEKKPLVGPQITRRTALLTGAAGVGVVGGGLLMKRYMGIADGGAVGARVVKAPLFAGGYGRDPDLISPQRYVWSSQLTDVHRRVITPLCDAILPAEEDAPAASAVGVDDFLDEWLSAPYPQQTADAAIIVPFIDELSQNGFEALSATEQSTLIRKRHDSGDSALNRVVELVAGAYHTTETGAALVGFIGNDPRPVFDGPPESTINLLRERLAAL